MSHVVEETYPVYDERQPLARKPHRCDACGEMVEPGQTYWRIRIVLPCRDGAETVKRCERCQALHVHLRGLSLETWPDERLACGLDYEEEWGELPEHVAALAFARPGEEPPNG